MKAIDQITAILSACGCNPTTHTDGTGAVTIKVNAPTIDTDERTRHNEKTEN